MFSPARRVDLFGVQCNTDVPDSDGCRWTIAKLPGWDGGEINSQTVAPTGQHGRAVAAQFADGRVIVPRGRVFAPSQAAAWAAYNRIVSSMPGLGGEGDVVAYEESSARFLRCRMQSPPKIDAPAGGNFEFELTLIAEYPFKRALTPVEVTIAAGTSETFTAAGNFAAEITVTSLEIGSMSLDAYGARLATSVSLPAGSVMDSLDRTIVNDIGENRYQFIQRNSQWLAVQPGSNTFANTGTADVVLSYYPTYA